MKRVIVVLLVLTCMVGMVFAKGEQQTGAAYPTRPLLMIIPFGPGGATDQLARKVQPVMEQVLGRPIAAQNMPGGATSLGNQYVFDQPHDGHTILAQPTDIVSIAVMGQSKLTYNDWSFIGIGVAVPTAFVVHPNSPIKTIEDLAATMKDKQLTAAVADSGCAWTRAVGLFSETLNLKRPQLVPSGGGYNAAVSAMRQEVDFAACGLAECIELVRGGELKALAYWGYEDFPIGTSKIPTLGNKYPALKRYEPFGGWAGLAVPKGTPQNIVNILIDAFKQATQAQEFKDFCTKSSFIFVGKYGPDADAHAKESTSVNAYLLYDMGFTKTDPATVGIQRLK